MAEAGPKKEMGNPEEEVPVGGMLRYFLHIDLKDVSDRTKRRSSGRAINNFMRGFGFDPRTDSTSDETYELWSVPMDFDIKKFGEFVETKLSRITSCRVCIVMIANNMATNYKFMAKNAADLMAKLSLEERKDDQ